MTTHLVVEGHICAERMRRCTTPPPPPSSLQQCWRSRRHQWWRICEHKCIAERNSALMGHFKRIEWTKEVRRRENEGNESGLSVALRYFCMDCVAYVVDQLDDLI